MARLVVEGFPDDLMRVFKVKAAQEGTSVKAIIIGWAKEGARTAWRPRSKNSKARI